MCSYGTLCIFVELTNYYTISAEPQSGSELEDEVDNNSSNLFTSET